MKQLFLLCLNLVLACPATAGTQVFNFRLQSEPTTLDWNLAADSSSSTIISNLMEGLASYDDKMNIRPALAKSWAVSKDAKTYTYKLREDVTWSDGVPLIAQQFIDSWERLLNPKTASENAYLLFDIVGARDFNSGKLTDANKLGFHALDAHTIEIKLNKPSAYFPHIPTFVVSYPIRLDLIHKLGDAWTKPENMPVIGPFLLADWKHNSRISLKPNPKYYGGMPKLSEANAYIISEDTTAINMFESGTLQYVSHLPKLELERLKKSPAFSTRPYFREYYYGFNTSKKPFDDIRVRQAFAYAIDRKQITDLLKGGQIPTTSWIPKGMQGFEPKLGLDFNAKKAQALLAEAGYPNGKDFPDVTFFYDTRDDNKIIAEKLLSLWHQILGVQLRAQNEEWKVYLSHLQSDAPPLFRLGWAADYPDPDNFMRVFSSQSANNYTALKNTAYDNLVHAAAAEEKIPKRLALYHKAQDLLLNQEAAIIPLFQDTINVLISPKVHGLILNAMDQLNLNKVTVQ